MSYNTISTWSYNGDPNIYTNGTSTTIVADELNKIINDLYQDTTDSFSLGDLFADEEGLRKPIRPSMEVGPALAEMINGDIKE